MKKKNCSCDVSELIFVIMLAVGQDPQLVTTDLFNGFLLSAQQETSCEKCQEVPLDVFLMNGYKVLLSVMTTERSDQVLEV
jgi:sorting nexin-17